MTDIAAKPGIKIPWLGIGLGLGLWVALATYVSNTFQLTTETVASSSDWETQGPSNCSDAYGAFDAFIPGMRGHGSCNRGGFVPGTNVVVVTNRNDSGAGSLRTAIQAACPKVVLFDVSGFWDITSGYNPSGDCQYSSYVGASAPGNVVIGGTDGHQTPWQLRGSDLTIDHMTIAPGYNGDVDAIAWGQTGEDTNTAIINVTALWTADEALSCYSNRTNDAARTTKTMVWQSLVSHGINPQPYGPLWHYTCPEFSYLRNVHVHMTDRNPMLRADQALVANNLVVNRRWQSAHVVPCTGNAGASHPPLTDINFINNIEVRGPNNTSNHGYIMGSGDPVTCTTFQLYEDGTQVMNADGTLQDCTNHGCMNISPGTSRGLYASDLSATVRPRALPSGFIEESSPATVAGVQALGQKLINYAGARPLDRLPYAQSRLDEAWANLTNSGDKGTVITAKTDVGGDAAITESPQSWTVVNQCPSHAGNPSNDPSSLSTSGSGLTNLHEWVIECFYDAVMPTGYREAL